MVQLTDSLENGATIESYLCSYDAGGNLVSDGRKGLQFTYNILNLPSVVTHSDGGVDRTVTYCYLSDGTKVSALSSGGSGRRYRGINHTLQVEVNIENSMKDSIYDNSYNLDNVLNGHEGYHVSEVIKKGLKAYLSTPQNMREVNAINSQMEYPFWLNTSQKFKNRTLRYLEKVTR